MPNYNKVLLMGTLTRDPEVRFASNEQAIVTFPLVVNRRYQTKAQDWIEEATFIDVTMFGKRGETFARFHKKGKPAFLEGALRLDKWDDKETGAKRSKLYVVADSWEFVNAGEAGGGGSSSPRQTRPPAVELDDSIF